MVNLPSQIGIKIDDIPFLPLEESAAVQGFAACADHTEVDLSTWIEPGKTLEVCHAMQPLRNFEVHCWARHMEQKGLAWLQSREGELSMTVRLSKNSFVGESCTGDFLQIGERS